MRIIVALLAATSTGAIAQTESASQASAEAVSTGDIIVTAQKRGELLSKVPIAISAVSSASLETAGVGGILELEQLVPSLQTSSAAHANNFWLPYIRGVGSNATAVGNNSSVATYIDGIYQPASTTNVQDFANVERIEVLKGPQGTLFGRNATGGAVHIITKKPSDTYELNAEASYGRFDEYSGKLYVTGPLGPTMKASLAYQHRGGGDYILNLLDGSKFGGFNNHAVHAKLLWNPSDRLEIGLAYIYAARHQTDSSQSIAFAPEGGPTVAEQNGVPVNYEPRKFLANRPYEMRNSKHEVHLNFKYSADAFDVVSITGFQSARNYTFLDFDSTTINGFYFNENDKIRAFTEELQFVSTGDGPLKWIVGLFYSSDIQAYAPLSFGIALPFPPTVANVLATGGTKVDINSESRSHSYAAFAQATYALGDSTNLTVGLRYTSEKRELNGTQAVTVRVPAPGGGFAPFSLIAAQSPANNSKTFKKPTWRISLDHSFTPDVMGYVSYNRGFKSGVFNATAVTQAVVDPEVLDAYEVGAKAKLFGGLASINVAAFYYDYKNIQVQITQTGVILLQNAAAAKLYGGEIEAVVRPIPSLVLRGSLSLLHSEYKDYLNAATFTLVNGAGVNSFIPDATGLKLIHSPSYAYNLSAEHTLDLSGGSSIVTTANWFYSDSYKTILGEGNFIRAYGTLGASLTWYAPDKKFYVGVYGRNLTNQEDVGRYLNTAGLERQLIRPRTYGLTVGMKLN